ncbi:hypothetical protein SD80_012915 [Scytonema tolypothrichoides VB-61278]|nr:hypothetical protein SD80_012915 [Scytonema tolypothrichoides VB-61278]
MLSRPRRSLRLLCASGWAAGTLGQSSIPSSPQPMRYPEAFVLLHNVPPLVASPLPASGTLSSLYTYLAALVWNREPGENQPVSHGACCVKRVIKR